MPELEVNRNGRCPSARQVASSNWSPRPAACWPELILVHGISLPPRQFGGDAIERLFTNRTTMPELAGLKVSAHFLIRRAGELIQFVPCDRQAWHAGQSTWQGRSECNSYSIGVELEGTDDIAYTDSQYDKLARLAVALRAAYPSLDSFAGHSHVAPERKTDPGPEFDWPRLLAAVGPGFNGPEEKES